MHGTHDKLVSSHGEHEDTQHAEFPSRLHLVAVPSGMATGRRRRVRGNVLAEWWTIFVTREQVEVCLTADPLRFEDPVLFAQIRREFDRVFDRPINSHEH